jgi:hypothetical protein
MRFTKCWRDAILVLRQRATLHAEKRRPIMKSNIVSISTMLLAAFWLSACKPTNDGADAGKAPTATPAPAPTAAAPSGLQACEDVGRLDAVVGDSVTTTCEIKLGGLDEGSSFKVELISGKVTEEGMPGEDSMVRVSKMVGADVGQVIEEAPLSLLIAPSYQDINGDKEGDLLIARDISNVNAVHAVWLGSPDGAPFVRVGEVAGEFRAVTADGYLTVTARSGAASQCVSFYSMADQQLSLQARACVTAVDEAATETNCVLEETEALNPVETTEENRAKFCAEPAVVNLYK